MKDKNQTKIKLPGDKVSTLTKEDIDKMLFKVIYLF